MFLATLKRELGLFEATMSGIGIILGAGIYVLVGKAAGIAGNAVWMSFLFGALVAALTGLSYAELSSMFPKAGAEYVYTKKAYGQRAAFLVGWMVVISGFFAAATVAVGFSGYLYSLISFPMIWGGLIIILLLSFILFYGVKESAWFAVISTLIEGGGLIVIILISLPFMGSVNYFESPGATGIFSAGALIFFAFIGFEQITRMSEETKNPKKTIPRALIISIIITTIIYVLVAISAVSVLGWEQLSASRSPLADVAAHVLGSNAFIALAVIALFSTSNTILLMMFSTSRMLYGMADFHCIPNALARIHKSRRTPWIAIVVVAVFTMIFSSIGHIETIAAITDFFIFTTFAVINICVIALRYKSSEKRTFRVPLAIGRFPVLPLLGAMTSLFLLTNLGYSTILTGILILLIGAGLYAFTNSIYGNNKRKAVSRD